MSIKQMFVHIVIGRESGFPDEQRVSVKLIKPGQIEKLRTIINSCRNGNDKAIMFALSNGDLVNPDDARGPVQVTLTRKHAYWDLIG